MKCLRLLGNWDRGFESHSPLTIASSATVKVNDCTQSCQALTPTATNLLEVRSREVHVTALRIRVTADRDKTDVSVMYKGEFCIRSGKKLVSPGPFWVLYADKFLVSVDSSWVSWSSYRRTDSAPSFSFLSSEERFVGRLFKVSY
jgi:hypothetical protein